MSETPTPPAAEATPSTGAKIGAVAKAAGGKFVLWVEGHPGPAFGFAIGVVIGWIAKTLI